MLSLFKLKTQTAPSRLTRWALQLSEYHFVARFLPGKANIIADYLSRESSENDSSPTKQQALAPLNPAKYEFHPPLKYTKETHQIQRAFDAAATPRRFDDLFSKQKFVDAQKNDQTLALLRSLLKKPTDEELILQLPTSYRQNYVQNLYRISKSTQILCYLKSYKALPIVPTSFQTDIIRYFHEHGHGHHQGADRMLDIMKDRIHWPTMRADTRMFCRSCHFCQTVKGGREAKLGKLQQFSQTSPFEMVCLDGVGPLPVSQYGNKYLLTIQDRFTRYVVAVPIPTFSSQQVAFAFLNEWIYKYGVHQQILAYNGSQFHSGIIKCLDKIMGIKHLFTSRYHPQTNGQIERFHRFLKERLVIVSQQRELELLKGDRWDVMIPSITAAYNATPTRMTGLSPHELVFGDKMRLPIDLHLQTLLYYLKRKHI